MKSHATKLSDASLVDENISRYARLLSLVLFSAAIVNTFLTVIIGMVAQNRLAIVLGGLGGVLGLLVLLCVSIQLNRRALFADAAPRRVKRFNGFVKLLEYFGYAFVVWSMVGMLFVLGLA